MNPVSRILAGLAAAIGFYGCDSVHLAALKPEVVWDWRIDPAQPGSRAFFHVHFSLDGFVTGTSRREETPGCKPA